MNLSGEGCLGAPPRYRRECPDQFFGHFRTVGLRLSAKFRKSLRSLAARGVVGRPLEAENHSLVTLQSLYGVCHAIHAQSNETIRLHHVASSRRTYEGAEHRKRTQEDTRRACLDADGTKRNGVLDSPRLKRCWPSSTFLNNLGTFANRTGRNSYRRHAGRLFPSPPRLDSTGR